MLVIFNIVPIHIGFEQTKYTVNESVGTVEVYVSVFDPPDEVILPLPIDLVIQTIPGTAGKDRMV